MSYEIRPLEWKVMDIPEEGHIEMAFLGIARLKVSRKRGIWIWDCDVGRSRTCEAASTLSECKQLAEAEYRRRLLPMLIEVKEATE